MRIGAIRKTDSRPGAARKKFVSVFMSVVLTVGLCPGLSYADEFTNQVSDSSSSASEVSAGTLEGQQSTGSSSVSIGTGCLSSSVASLSLSASSVALYGSADDAIEWVRQREGQSLDYDNDEEYLSTDLIRYYYAYLNKDPQGADASDYLTNDLPEGWTRVQGGVPSMGDILVYTTEDGADHLGIFESESISYHEGFDGEDSVQRLTFKYNDAEALTASSAKYSYWGIIHPDFTPYDPSPGSASGGYVPDDPNQIYENGFLFQLIDDGDATTKTYSIIRYDGEARILNIPSATSDGTVVEIADSVFAEKENLIAVTVPDTITSIGYYAFANCRNLGSVKLSSSLTYLGNEAFLNDSLIASVTIPASLTDCGWGSQSGYPATEYYGPFDNCHGLRNVAFETGTAIIPDGLFAGCTGLETVTIPDDVESVGYAAFASCTKLTSVHLPNSLKSLSALAFYDDDGLKDISIPSTLEYCPSYAYSEGPFEQCSNLAMAAIEEGMSRVPARLFFSCTGLETVSIPDGVTAIEDCAFYECSHLVDINFPATLVEIGDSAFYGCGYFQDVKLPDSITSIGSSAFANCPHIKSVNLPTSLSYLGNDAFCDDDSISTITIPAALNDCGASSQSGDPMIYGGPFNECSGLKSVLFEDGATSLPDYLFAGCDELEQISLPDQITSIGYGSFASCAKLSSVHLPSSLESLSAHAFYDCDALEAISIPASLKRCPNYYYQGPFEQCDNLSSVVFESGMEKVPSCVLYSCPGVETVSIPDGVVAIEDHAFAQCEKLAHVNFPATITEIDYDAFMGCTSLQAIVLPDSITTLGSGVFAQCTNLSSVTLSESLSYLGGDAFYDDDLLVSITIPASLVECGSRYQSDAPVGHYGGPFAECDGLKNVTFSNNSEKIPDYVLAGCTGIEQVSIPNSITEIGDGAFASCANLSVVNMSANLVTLGYYAFGDCPSLLAISLPSTTTTIGNDAFVACTALKDVALPTSMESIGDRAFEYCEGLETLIFPKQIGEWCSIFGVCAHCSSLKSVKLPENLEAIDTEAFYSCASLTDVEIPASVERIGDSAFSSCTALKSISIPGSVTVLGSSAFEDCTALESVEVERGLETVGYNAFQNCDKLTAIEFPNSVKYLEDGAFYDCDALKSVTLSTGISEIGSEAFRHCDSLETIVIPYRVTSIGASAFAECVKLTSATIPQATQTIGDNAFSYADRMTIYGVAGTEAESYAKAHNFTFVAQSIAPTSVSITPSEVSVVAGSTYVLESDIKPMNFTGTVTWKSTNEDVATVDQYGVLTAWSTGTTTIRLAAGNQATTCKVTVLQPVSYIDIEPSYVVLDVDDAVKLTGTAYPEDAYDKSFTWRSDDENVATVDSDGTVYAIARGETDIYAEASDGSGSYGRVSIDVRHDVTVAHTVSELQSDHPYDNNLSMVYKYSIPNAEALDVTFDESTSLEDGCDFITILGSGDDYDSYDITRYTGTELAGKTINVVGDTVKILLETDEVVGDYGFKVSSVVSTTPAKTDAEIAQEVVEEIDALPYYDDITLADSPAIQAARDHYDALTSDQKDLVNNEYLLVNAEARIEELEDEAASNEKVQNVANLIAALPATSNITLDDVPDIKIARDAYDQLSASEQSLVENYDDLEAAETRVEALYEQENQRIADQQAADEVSAIIDSLPAVEDLTLDDAEDVELARVAYDDLTADQKALVTNYDVLQAAEAQIVVLETMDLADAELEITPGNLQYDGLAKTPSVVVKLGGNALVADADFEVSYKDNTNVGTATVTVTGKGKYVGSITGSFAIAPASIGSASVAFSPARYTFDGTVATPSVKVVLGDRTLAEGDDYELSWQEGRADAGTYAVTATGKGNYTGTVTGSFAIAPASIGGASVELSQSSFAYDGTAKEPAVTVRLGGRTLAAGTDYGVSYADNVVAGTATATVTGKGNYSGTVTTTFEIAPAGISAAKVAFSTNDFVYDGIAKTPLVTVELEGKILNASTDYETVFSDNVGPGTATATVTGKGNYTGTAAATFTIAPCPVESADVELSPDSYAYDGTAKEPAVAVKIGGRELVPGADYDVAYSGNVDAGTAVVTVAGKGNYTGAATRSFAIAPASIGSASVAFSPARYTFDGTVATPSVKVVLGDRTLAEGDDYELSWQEGRADAGTYAVTATGKGNYTGTVTGSFAIAPASIGGASVELSQSSFAYDGTAKEPAVTVRLGGRTLAAGTDYGVSYADNVVAGTATATVTGKGNYSGTAAATFEIVEPAPSVIVDEDTGVVAEGQDLADLVHDDESVQMNVTEPEWSAAEPDAATARDNAVKAGASLVTLFDVTLDVVNSKGVVLAHVTENINMTLTFPVGNQFNGKIATVTQIHAGVALAPKTAVVVNGSVSVAVTGLSQFVIAVADEAIEPSPDPSPSPDPEPTPSPEPTPTPGPTPTPDPEPAPDPEPTPTPSPDPEPTPTPDPEPAPAAGTLAMHRLYNQWTGEHFYTADEGERDRLVEVGWTYEGVGWDAPEKSNTPVYRLYNRYVPGGDHHYTTDASERDHLVDVGWSYEGIGWYSDDAKSVPLYRQYNPYAETGTHNYTRDKSENDYLVEVGWRAEGVGWYGV